MTPVRAWVPLFVSFTSPSPHAPLLIWFAPSQDLLVVVRGELAKQESKTSDEKDQELFISKLQLEKFVVVFRLSASCSSVETKPGPRMIKHHIASPPPAPTSKKS